MPLDTSLSRGFLVRGFFNSSSYASMLYHMWHTNKKKLMVDVLGMHIMRACTGEGHKHSGVFRVTFFVGRGPVLLHTD